MKIQVSEGALLHERLYQLYCIVANLYSLHRGKNVADGWWNGGGGGGERGVGAKTKKS